VSSHPPHTRQPLSSSCVASSLSHLRQCFGQLHEAQNWNNHPSFLGTPLHMHQRQVCTCQFVGFGQEADFVNCLPTVISGGVCQIRLQAAVHRPSPAKQPTRWFEASSKELLASCILISIYYRSQLPVTDALSVTDGWLLLAALVAQRNRHHHHLGPGRLLVITRSKGGEKIASNQAFVQRMMNADCTHGSC